VDIAGAHLLIDVAPLRHPGDAAIGQMTRNAGLFPVVRLLPEIEPISASSH
jgi:hypothetical protein